MNNLKITMLILLTSCFATAQNTAELVNEVMASIRQGEYPNVNAQDIYKAPASASILLVPSKVMRV